MAVDLDAVRADLASRRAEWEGYMSEDVGGAIDLAETLADEIERLRGVLRDVRWQCEHNGGHQRILNIIGAE